MKKNGLKKTVETVYDLLFRKKNPPVKHVLSGIDTRSYKLPELLCAEDELSKTIEFFVCANTTYNPSKGNVGGPGTVVATIREVMGSKYRGARINYIFENKPARARHFSKILLDAPISMRYFVASYAIENGLVDWERYGPHNDFFFICHDVGVAYGAYLRGCKYVLVYHQQGALVFERKSNGDILTSQDIELANKIEDLVFSNAEKVYFPSHGAEYSFLETTEMDVSKINISEEPLYNTIPEKPKMDINGLISEINLPPIDRKTTDVFLSIGDYSQSKGLDRIPAFIEEYCRKSGRKAIWIAFGKKLSAGIYEKLISERGSWSFESYLHGERIKHDTILALMDFTDYYIMAHRHSIFDLATLEAMRASAAVILSDIPGNTDFNKEDNIILVDFDNVLPAVKRLCKYDKKELGQKNASVFNNYFSKKCYYERYAKLFDEQFVKNGIDVDRHSSINEKSINRLAGAIKKKTILLSNVDYRSETEKYDFSAVVTNLGHVLFSDIVFNSEYKPNLQKNQITRANEGNYRNENLVLYEVAPVDVKDYKQLVFDNRYIIHRSGFMILDALQFLVYAGAKEIKLRIFGELVENPRFEFCTNELIQRFKEQKSSVKITILKDQPC